MAPSSCPHVKPRLDGAVLGPCYECKPPDPNRMPGFTFNGGGEQNNRQAFHDKTIGEALREQGHHSNPDAEPVGQRWV